MALAQGVGSVPIDYQANTASLGIGIDVLAQAYGFAARRVGVDGDLDLRSCTDARCVYAFGEGVTVIADYRKENLDIHRIEATLDPSRALLPAQQRRYEQACLTIVALVDPHASAEEQLATATAISSLASVKASRFRLELPARDIRVYGSPANRIDENQPNRVGDSQPTNLRCGAIAVL